MAEVASNPDTTPKAEEEVQNIYDEIEIDDMDFEDGKFFYPCPCGDKFQINIVSEFRGLFILHRNKYLREVPSPHVLVARFRSGSSMTMIIYRILSRTTASKYEECGVYKTECPINKIVQKISD